MAITIGLTYDLRIHYLNQGYSLEQTAEFDRESTIDFLEEALFSLGHSVKRIGNIEELVRKLSDGERWDLVFNIAEGLSGLGREAQIPALLDAYSIPYTFSDPLRLSVCLHKGYAKRIFRDFGIPTTDFRIINNISDIRTIPFDFPIFLKPVAEGTSKGVDQDSKALDEYQLEKKCRQLLTSFNQPVLAEPFLPGREFTVGIIGTGEKASALGTLEIILLENAETEAYSYFNKENCELLVNYQLAEDSTAKEAEYIALDAWKKLGLRDAGRVDLRCGKDGTLYIIEINPLSGLHPEHSDLPILAARKGVSYLSLIKMIMDSALERTEQKLLHSGSSFFINS